jgi:catechol 2,3-dioxygenase-like lactoylglutathione lyase family enzyme
MDTQILDCKHITYRVTDIAKSKSFYVEQLGLTLLDEKPNFMALKIGDLRLSFFGGHKSSSDTSEEFIGTSIVLATENIEQTKELLISRGITLHQDIVNANNYLKFIMLKDPDGLIVEIAEYLIKDTLENNIS